MNSVAGQRHRLGQFRAPGRASPAPPPPPAAPPRPRSPCAVRRGRSSSATVSSTSSRAPASVAPRRSARPPALQRAPASARNPRPCGSAARPCRSVRHSGTTPCQRQPAVRGLQPDQIVPGRRDAAPIRRCPTRPRPPPARRRPRSPRPRTSRPAPAPDRGCWAASPSSGSGRGRKTPVRSCGSCPGRPARAAVALASTRHRAPAPGPSAAAAGLGRDPGGIEQILPRHRHPVEGPAPQPRLGPRRRGRHRLGQGAAPRSGGHRCGAPCGWLRIGVKVVLGQIDRVEPALPDRPPDRAALICRQSAIAAPSRPSPTRG